MKMFEGEYPYKAINDKKKSYFSPPDQEYVIIESTSLKLCLHMYNYHTCKYCP